ncbi:MAG: DUF3572 domain-containing protein [Pseudomonadota bacterium]
MTPETATDVAISGLQFIAGDSEQLSRFVALSGVDPENLRSLAQSPDFMVAILDYFLGDEPTLLAFTASAGIDPREVQQAKIALAPESADQNWP